jgi:CHAT domain-containing protein
MAIGCSTPTLIMPESVPPIVKEHKHITLWGNRPGMLNTGLHLNKGDTYSILATGSIDLSVPAGSWFKYHDVRPEHGWPLMVRIGNNRYTSLLWDRNAISITSDYSGDLFLGIRDGEVDKYGSPLRPDYYSDNAGSFGVDVIVWEKADWVQISEFFRKMREKDPGNKAIMDALNPENRLAGAGPPPTAEEKRMSLEEAEQVAVSMSEKPFVPPPRRIDDILSMLNQPGQFDAEATAKHKARADAPPPDTEDPAALTKFYLRRGRSAGELGRSKQSLEDLRRALHYAEMADEKKVSKLVRTTLGFLGNAEAEFGNFSRAIAAHKRVLKTHPTSQSYSSLMSQYISTGDLKAAERIKEEGIRFCDQIISSSKPRGLTRTWAELHKAGMLASMLGAKGKHAEAEAYRRYILNYMNQPGTKHITIKAFPRAYLMRRLMLAMNLMIQGRLVEAELEAREALKQSLGLGGKDSETTAKMLSSLGMIYVSQGRLDDAEAITHAAIRALEASGLSRDSARMGWVKMLLGTISVARLNFTEAMQRYDNAKQGMIDNEYFYENRFTRSPHVILSLLKTGRAEEAMASITKWYSKYNEYFGKRHYRTAQMLGLRGMANAMMGNEVQALEDFSEAVPILSEKTGDECNYPKRLRLKIIVESYLDLLTEIYKGKREKAFGVDTSAEMFTLCQEMSGSIVQNALGASGARAAALDPELADLVRKEQDTLKQIDALQAILSDAIAAPRDQQNPDALRDLKAAIDSLSRARSVLIDEIKRRFPRYADFTDPQPVTFSEAQKHLRPSEALIVIFPADVRTYVWAIPHKGEIIFAVAPLNEGDLQGTIAHLRGALDIDPGTFGDIPKFDLPRAYSLYRQLLHPVEQGWKDAQDLIVVAHGPLAQLPFSVLPTTSVVLGPEKYELFATYRKVPWLIRTVSITRQPSVSSFVTLRNLPEGDPDRRAFAGFGDPIFNGVQLALAESQKDGLPIDFARGGKRVHVRSIRITEQGDLDNAQILSSHLGMLNPLPDTAEEIKSIAKTLGADPTRDIFLGKNASEKQVKSMDLSNRRVIAFASHALVPGDLDGLDQPAIALSAPSVTGDDEDGLLTMEEVLRLRLNADWVVLSACNTGAAYGAGAEAVSGLGRAFFYAGTRTILVSMWPVETTSAMKLTTGLFQYQKANETLSRARALQKSMLALIDSPGLIDDATGKIVASYAHPLFWAPFIVVGESS